MEHRIKIKVNGHKVEKSVNSSKTLLEFLREDLALTGVKEGCGVGECGACTVIMDGSCVRSCLILAVEADGSEITTVEGLADKDNLSLVQQAFVETAAVQCGFCTPGFVIAIENLFRRNPDPSKEEVLEALGGHLCRCTGYVQIFEAVERVREKMKALK